MTIAERFHRMMTGRDRAIAARQIHAPVPEDVTRTLEQVLAETRRFYDAIPETYLLAKTRYPFLPIRCVQLDAFWADASPMARAAFLLDQITTLYAPCAATAEQVAQAIGDRPTLVYRTPDHPKSNSSAASTDPRCYSLLFDTDAGARVEMHFGHTRYVGLAMMLAGERRERRAC